jgi:hypothetical protein
MRAACMAGGDGQAKGKAVLVTVTLLGIRNALTSHGLLVRYSQRAHFRVAAAHFQLCISLVLWRTAAYGKYHNDSHVKIHFLERRVDIMKVASSN